MASQLDESKTKMFKEILFYLESATKRNSTQMGKAETRKLCKNLAKLCGFELGSQTVTDRVTFLTPTVTVTPPDTDFFVRSNCNENNWFDNDFCHGQGNVSGDLYKTFKQTRNPIFNNERAYLFGNEIPGVNCRVQLDHNISVFVASFMSQEEKNI